MRAANFLFIFCAIVVDENHYPYAQKAHHPTIALPDTANIAQNYFLWNIRK